MSSVSFQQWFRAKVDQKMPAAGVVLRQQPPHVRAGSKFMYVPGCSAEQGRLHSLQKVPDAGMMMASRSISLVRLAAKFQAIALPRDQRRRNDYSRLQSMPQVLCTQMFGVRRQRPACAGVFAAAQAKGNAAAAAALRLRKVGEYVVPLTKAGFWEAMQKHQHYDLARPSSLVRYRMPVRQVADRVWYRSRYTFQLK
jgi:hypothetical protein